MLSTVLISMMLPGERGGRGLEGLAPFPGTNL